MQTLDTMERAAARATPPEASDWAASAADVAAIVAAAAAGQGQAWDALVARFSPLLVSIARRVGLDGADAADVCQTTWLRLLQHLDTIEQHERVGSWLATTARREAVRVSQRRRRDVLTDASTGFDASRLVSTDPVGWDDGDAHELAAAVSLLPQRSQALVALLLADPPYHYADISTILGIPVGSIGPTRARILATLRSTLEGRGMRRMDLQCS